MLNKNNCHIEYNFDVSALNTYGTGGRAKCVYFPKSEEEAVSAFKFVKENYEKFVILGNGSNVLISDEFFDGAIISTKYLNKISFDGNNLICQSGVTVPKLLKFCIKNGLTGLEYLAGIPASVGGLAFMNGGINERHIGDDVIFVETFDSKLCKISNEYCNFDIKHSTMRDINCLILSVCIKIAPSDSDTVKENIKKFINLRSIQPKGRSCGCVFKNPNNLTAGKLIDEAGLKGLAIGSAYVSDRHANFIINEGKRSDDVYRLIREVKRRVFEKYGVFLEEEVVYIGEFNETDS